MAFDGALCYAAFMQITVEIPDRFAEQLVPPGRDAGRMLLEEAVAGAYRDRRLTMEQVRELLSLATRFDVDGFLQRHQVYDYSAEDLSRHMDTLARLSAAESGFRVSPKVEAEVLARYDSSTRQR
jgi:hypothetical protein